MPARSKSKDQEQIVIEAPNIRQTTVAIVGISPLVQNKFSAKARMQMEANMTTPAAEKPGRKARALRNFTEEYEQAQHRGAGGWNGIPCVAFRAAMIRACTLVKAKIPMTTAKMAVFVIPDGFDVEDGTPLTRVYSESRPEEHHAAVRLETGVADVRSRPMWRQWSAKVTIEYDADMIPESSVVNLLERAGRQVGVQEGRNFSKNSVGQGWGSFRVMTGEEIKQHESSVKKLSSKSNVSGARKGKSRA